MINMLAVMRDSPAKHFLMQDGLILYVGQLYLRRPQEEHECTNHIRERMILLARLAMDMNCASLYEAIAPANFEKKYATP